MALSFKRTYRRFGALIPRGMRKNFGRKLNHAGIRDEAQVWLGERLLLSFLMGLVALALYLALYNPVATTYSVSLAIGLFIYGLGSTLTLFYLELYFKVVDRASKVEKILPDFLLLTVSNLRAGMTPFSAFVNAAKPEFGPLYYEVRYSTAKSGGTSSFVEALHDMSLYFDSKVLHRTVNLFAKGIRSGGQLAKLLKESADEVQHLQDLRAELATQTRTYTIFLGFILILVMPFLLSVSTQFVTVFLVLRPESTVLDVEGAGNIPSFSGDINITPEEMFTTSLITLLLTCLLVSGLLGIINKGRALYGIKYFPALAILSVLAFFLSRELIGGMFASFAL